MEIILLFSLLAVMAGMMMRNVANMEMMAMPIRVKVLAAIRKKKP